MTQRNEGGPALVEGASGRVETDEAGRRFFVTGDGRRIPMGGAGEQVTLPAAAAGAARAGSTLVMADGSTMVVGIPAEAAAAPDAVAGGLAAGASGRVETDEAGRRFFVTADGRRVPMGGGAGQVTLPAAAGAQARAGAQVALGDGLTLAVGVTPAEAVAHTGGIAPATGIGATAVPAAPTGRADGPRIVPQAQAAAATSVTPADTPPAGASPAAGTNEETMRLSDGDAIDLRSEELQEIISLVPHWLVRCGTTVFFVTVLALLALSWLIHYPDVVDGRLTLTTPSPPVRIVARGAGDLQQVLVADHEMVRRDAPLAVLRSPADWRDVFRLSQRLDALGAALASGGPLPADRFDPTLDLGDIQPAYADLMRRLGDHAAFAAGAYDREKIAGVEREMAGHSAMRDRLEAQQRLLLEQLQLAERKRDRARQLAGQELISQADVDQAEAEAIQARYAVRNGESALTSNSLETNTGSQTLLDLRQKLLDDERQQRTELRAAYDALRSAILRWDQEYVLRAPVAGQVSFFENAHADQFVQAAQPVMAVVPNGQALVATALVPESRAGKVRVGQRVIVTLDSYPAAEFGSIDGRVERISLVANAESADKEAMYLVRVSFPRGLVTTYGRRLPFRQEMRGTGGVVTQDRRLVQRIFDQLLYAANRASH